MQSVDASLAALMAAAESMECHDHDHDTWKDWQQREESCHLERIAAVRAAAIAYGDERVIAELEAMPCPATHHDICIRADELRQEVKA